VLLGQVLETRNKAYGENAPECADTYLYYGQCLFEQAQVRAAQHSMPACCSRAVAAGANSNLSPAELAQGLHGC
jgi:hypothetical protein